MGAHEAQAQGVAEPMRGARLLTHPVRARPCQSMCLLESELEAQLGVFHLRMKGTEWWGRRGWGEGSVCLRPLPQRGPSFPPLPGLAGFARLCVGDQYEV